MLAFCSAKYSFFKSNHSVFDSTRNGITSSPILCLSLCFFLCFLFAFSRDPSFISPVSFSSSVETSNSKLTRNKRHELRRKLSLSNPKHKVRNTFAFFTNFWSFFFNTVFLRHFLNLRFGSEAVCIFRAASFPLPCFD